MQSSATPPKIALAWADNGQRNVIPVPSQVSVTPGLASWTDGFPPITMTPARAGGIPPFGQDFNGALHDLSAWTVWGCAGGPVGFDAAFAASIGGYPKGARVSSNAVAGLTWISVADGNAADPDAGGPGWLAVLTPRLDMQAFTTSGSFIVPLGVVRLKLRLYGAGGPGGHGNGGGGGGGSAGGHYEAYAAVHPGDTLTMQVGAGGNAGNLVNGNAVGATGGALTQVLLNGQTIAGASGGGGGGLGPTGPGNTDFGRGLGDANRAFLPYGQSGQNGASSSALNYGGAGGGVYGFQGGAAQVVASTANADANGNSAQTGCGGGGGVGNGLGGNGGGGLILVEF